MSVNDRLGEIEVFADPLLERVFHNLLDNTIRHGKHAKIITLTSVPAGRELLIQWQDDGEGVPDVDKERIFERGFGKHTGLGLFLVREILEPDRDHHPGERDLWRRGPVRDGGACRCVPAGFTRPAVLLTLPGRYFKHCFKFCFSGHLL